MRPSLRAMELSGFRIAAVRGREQVLAHHALLVALAARCGQRGIVDHLAFRFSDPYFGAKLPSLFVFYEAGAASSRGALPVAAVLLNEYRLLGVRTGIYMPADLAGDWTILAPGELRAAVTHEITAHLLHDGARVVLLSCSGSPSGLADRRESRGLPPPIATAERPLLRTLPLQDSLDTTLGTMGAHTRRNLRLARRQAAVKLGAYFEGEPALSEDEFLAINREGFYPVPNHVASWRFRSARENAGGFITGVRTSAGEWLALLGGRRYLTDRGSCTAVDWQWNRTSFAKYSPGSLMRIVLIEDELERGTAELRFEGGTPHSMRSAFQQETVTDLLYTKRRGGRMFVRLLARVLPKGNLLGDVLTSRHLIWRE